MLRSEATSILDDLPCFQVNHWDEVTEDKLNKELEPLTERFKSPSMEKIWLEHWHKKIMEA